MSKMFDRLEFDQQGSLNKQVGPETFIESQPCVLNGDNFLSFDENPTLFKHFCKHNLINGLKQPWPQILVHMKGGINHFGRYLLNIFHSISRENAKNANYG
ncbi:MAG: hypothetical protein ACD_75C01545G0002 [uncultured bacterium]|nr:MAG: hypothetical protein ACD_75C01545G0002 [uncultured bacterium]